MEWTVREEAHFPAAAFDGFYFWLQKKKKKMKRKISALELGATVLMQNAKPASHSGLVPTVQHRTRSRSLKTAAQPKWKQVRSRKDENFAASLCPDCHRHSETAFVLLVIQAQSRVSMPEGSKVGGY